MHVTLRWIKSKADRHAGHIERWDMSAQGELAEQWIANGWAEIISSDDTLSASVDEPPSDRSVKKNSGKRKVVR